MLWLDRAGARSRAPKARPGTRVVQTLTAFGLGCIASAGLSDSALAPVGPARAAINPAMVDPIAVAPPGRLAILDEVAPAPGSAREEAQREEVEAYLRFGARDVSRRIVETIVRAANATAVDPVYLMALADKESGFRTDVKASTSSAEGLFQFVDRTWLEMVRSHGAEHGLGEQAAAIALVEGRPVVADEAVRSTILQLRRDPYIAAVLAAELLKKDAAQIGFRIGRRLNRTEMYLAHFLGLEQAARFLDLKERRRSPRAANVFPAAARANTAIFFQRGRRGKLQGLSVGQVYERIDRMIGTRAEIYRDVGNQAKVAPI